MFGLYRKEGKLSLNSGYIDIDKMKLHVDHFVFCNPIHIPAEEKDEIMH